MEEEIKKTAVTPIGDFNCQSFPLIEGNVYYATDEELDKLGNHELKWTKDENGKPMLIPNDPTDENKQKSYRKRIAELKALLAGSDYKALKYAEGLISETEYIITKAQRQAWRDEINTLEGMLK